MRDLILRDRHHPSIILWGMGNESRSRTAYLELRKIARELDPLRPVTYAENHLYRARREKTIGIPDVWSVNYELEAFEKARNACRLQNVIASECCNFPRSVKGDDGAELIQVATLEYEWKLMEDRPYVAGHAVWSFTDYATEYRKRYRRQAGLFDAWRRPKMAAELFRARYAQEPFVSLFVTEPAGNPELHVFSNCDRIRLTLQGKTPVSVEGQVHYALSIDGPFAGAKAEGTRGGVTVHQELKAWSDAKAMAITVDDNPQPGRTVAVDLSIVDAIGTSVRDWNGHVTLSVEGNARLRAYTEAGEVQISRGEGRAYIQLDQPGGEVVIRAAASGLEPASITISPRQ
jgi:hypothetical protein